MSLRTSLLKNLEETQVAEGFRLLRFHMGAPASAAKLDAIEREVLHAPMPKPLRDFYLEMDGLQLVEVATFEPGEEPFPPLTPEDPSPMSWLDTTSEFHGVWPQIIEATPKFGYAGIVNIPDVETVFRHDWVRAFGHPGVYWFDFFHHYYAAYLTMREGELVVGLAEDAMASLYDSEPISVEEYLTQVAQPVAGRKFSGRWMGDHQRGSD